MSKFQTGYTLSCFAFVVALASACIVDVNRGDTVFSCQETPVCPNSLVCIAGVCTKSTLDGGIDPDARRRETLHYSFDDDYSSTVWTVHDRSGNRIDGLDDSSHVKGKYGDAINLLTLPLDVPDSPLLYSGNTITIEAYVFHEQNEDGFIYGDLDINGEDLEYSLGINNSGQLEFLTQLDCTEAIVTFSSTSSVGLNDWHHVAVTWDGIQITFFIDGVESGTSAHNSMPCESAGPRPYRIGLRHDNTGAFTGRIDEIKVSGFAKTTEEILASMAFDSTEVIGLCGDQLLEDEACIAGTLCCTDTCQPASAGSACGIGGSCNSTAACLIGGGRVSEGLLVLYTFDEGDGVTVRDRSSRKPLLDLLINSESAVTWNDDSLTINSDVKIFSSENATKISSVVRDSNEVSIEAWVAPANATQGGPARIISISEDTQVRNLTLGQAGEAYVARFRSTTTTANALLVVDTPRGDVVVGKLTHLVATRSPDGTRRMYVDGVLRSVNFVGGDFSEWQEYPIVIADELTGARAWLGTIHLTAIYGRALTESEVAQNFASGP